MSQIAGGFIDAICDMRLVQVEMVLLPRYKKLKLCLTRDIK
jgi:hypothetical protein